jgi:hypothetical protein
MGETAALAWADSHGLACLCFVRTASGVRARPSKAFVHRFGAVP